MGVISLIEEEDPFTGVFGSFQKRRFLHWQRIFHRRRRSRHRHWILWRRGSLHWFLWIFGEDNPFISNITLTEVEDPFIARQVEARQVEAR